jgi:hypothetical protein
VPYCFELSTEVTDSNMEAITLDRSITHLLALLAELCVQEMDYYWNKRIQNYFELLVESSAKGLKWLVLSKDQNLIKIFMNLP